MGSALIQSLRMVGGAFGAAILGSVLNASYRAQLQLDGLPSQAAAGVRDSVAAGTAIARQLGSADLLDHGPRRLRARHGHGVPGLRRHHDSRCRTGARSSCRAASRRRPVPASTPALAPWADPKRPRTPAALDSLPRPHPLGSRMPAMAKLSVLERPAAQPARAQEGQDARGHPGARPAALQRNRATPAPPSSRSPPRPRSRRAPSSATSRPRKTWSSSTPPTR